MNSGDDIVAIPEQDTQESPTNIIQNNSKKSKKGSSIQNKNNKKSQKKSSKITIILSIIAIIFIFTIAFMIQITTRNQQNNRVIQKQANFSTNKQNKQSNSNQQIHVISKSQDQTINIQKQQTLQKSQNKVIPKSQDLNLNAQKQQKSSTIVKPDFNVFPKSYHFPPNPTLVSILKEYYKEKKVQSILQFGCGECQLIKILKNQGYQVLAYDATPYSNQSYVKQKDLSKQIRQPKLYDYVQSFQVGEHIFQKYQDVFIENLAKNAKYGIFMSWAIPGQGGVQHINQKSNQYIIKKIQKYGFTFNRPLTDRYKLQFEYTHWFRNSLMIFQKNQTISTPAKPDFIVFPKTAHFPPNPTLVKILKQYYKEKKVQSILQFGCGQCQLIKILKNQNYEVLALDATPYANQSYIQQKDLSKQIRLPKLYDYVQSFQVGEHIYSEFQDVFIENLAKNAKNGIFMSWAIPGQGGFQHINQRSNQYIINKVQKYGFTYNRVLTLQYKVQFTDWFRNSLMVFQKLN